MAVKKFWNVFGLGCLQIFVDYLYLPIYSTFFLTFLPLCKSNIFEDQVKKAHIIAVYILPY